MIEIYSLINGAEFPTGSAGPRMEEQPRKRTFSSLDSCSVSLFQDPYLMRELPPPLIQCLSGKNADLSKQR